MSAERINCPKSSFNNAILELRLPNGNRLYEGEGVEHPYAYAISHPIPTEGKYLPKELMGFAIASKFDEPPLILIYTAGWRIESIEDKKANIKNLDTIGK